LIESFLFIFISSFLLYTFWQNIFKVDKNELLFFSIF